MDRASSGNFLVVDARPNVCRKPVFAPCDDAVRWQMPTNQEDMPHSELIGTEIS